MTRIHKGMCMCALLLAAALPLSACGSSAGAEEAAAVEVSVRQTIEVADPAGAVDAIYQTLEDREVAPLDAKGLEDYMNIEAADLVSFVVYRSEAKAGLCDVAIVQPTDDSRDDIREALLVYKDQRIEEFRNYDILDAFSIAQNAVVYDQGDYVVMLMLPDNEAAQELLDEYIPQ